MLFKKNQNMLFHALTYLGKNKDQGAILISEISEKHNISHKFLENILLELRRKPVF